MKYAVALVAVSTAALVMLTAYAVVQEVRLKHLITHKAASAEALDVKEETIVSEKKQVTQLRLAMETERTKTKELEKRRGDIENSKKEAEEKLKTCNSDKESNGKKKTETETAINDLKDKKPLNQMKEEIDKLKKSVKSRDQIICSVADKSQDEAKKLCAEDSK
ncbi:ankycorbin [Takifugu rubripes]|uniref:ankycorbin n=1 Tax=Takifugu rubripes TaxID=31033 RepID=UPI0005D23247|nr:ankycorbin-like [Takifugu rubripes]|eukprot:XP_011603930.1 PREDICTED: ankycorbin-like [Takifugu rubripes]